MDSITTTLARTKLAIAGDMWSFQDWLIDELPDSLSGSDALDIAKRFGADFLRWVIYRTTESEDTPLVHMTAQEFGGQIFAQVMLDQPSDPIAAAAYDELIAAIRAKYLAAPVAEAKEHPAPEVIDDNTASMLEAVRGWPAAKQRGIRRQEYCDHYGIDASTLTKWRDKLRDEGHDVPDFTQ